MTQTIKHISKADISGTAMGVLFMAFFGTMWAYLGTMGIQQWGSPWVLVISLVIGLSLFVGGCSLLINSRKVPNQLLNKKQKPSGKFHLWFNVIFVAEGIAIFITIAVCNATGYPELIPLLIAVIVGIHFFPLAYLFQVKVYYITGSLLCLFPVITWLFVPHHITLQDQQINVYMTVIGFSSAFVLWGTSAVILTIGKKLAKLT